MLCRVPFDLAILWVVLAHWRRATLFVLQDHFSVLSSDHVGKAELPLVLDGILVPGADLIVDPVTPREEILLCLVHLTTLCVELFTVIQGAFGLLGWLVHVVDFQLVLLHL